MYFSFEDETVNNLPEKNCSCNAISEGKSWIILVLNRGVICDIVEGKVPPIAIITESDISVCTIFHHFYSSFNFPRRRFFFFITCPTHSALHPWMFCL